MKGKRIISILLIVAMVLGVFPIQTDAAIGLPQNDKEFVEVNRGDEVQCGILTQSRVDGFSKNYTLTGDGATDMVAIALAQEGRTGANFGYTEEWCADFVSDCAILAGQGAAVPQYGGVSGLYSRILSAGGAITTSSPQPGDICFIDWNKGSSMGHVEIVYAVSGTTVYAIGGNSGSGSTLYTRSVKKHAPLSSGYVVAVVRPAYVNKHYDNPSVAGTYWGNQTDTTFRPVVVIDNPECVREVRFAVWTTGDQSDLKWYGAYHNGVGGYFNDISFTDFSNKIFICHVYVYGMNGSVQSIEMERLDVNNYEKPNIKGVYWGNQTDTTFRPVLEINNPECVKEVRFAVWTTGDQSDLKWYGANYNGVSAYFKDIEFSDFPEQRYFCHGYVYGKDGSTQSIAMNSIDTYNAQGKLENVVGNIGSITIEGYAFDKSDKNESIGVHCYLKDSEGNATFLGGILADEERIDVDNEYSVGNNHGFSETFITSLYGTYTVEVSAINIGGGNSVTFLGAETIVITQPEVSFDSCGGTQCAPIKVVNGEGYGKLPVPTKEGYTFAGWYTEEDGGQEITGNTLVVLENHQTLYAIWEKDNIYTNPFSDVANDAWYASAVQYVYDNGIMSGSAGLFSPNNSVTRSMVVETPYKMEGKPAVSDFAIYDQYTDLDRYQWWANSVSWAMNLGIATGDNYYMKFNPETAVTREQLATFLYRYAKYKNLDVTLSKDASAILAGAYVNSYARDAFAWAVDIGLISGVESNGVKDLDSQGVASRAQMAAIMQRLANHYKDI